jgi:hypothetical protein
LFFNNGSHLKIKIDTSFKISLKLKSQKV